MTDEQAERLIRALETIAAKMPSPPIGGSPIGPWPVYPPQVPHQPQFYPMTPVVACNCPPNHICMSVSCPRGLRSATAQVSDATQQYHYQSDGVTSAVATTQE